MRKTNIQTNTPLLLLFQNTVKNGEWYLWELTILKSIHTVILCKLLEIIQYVSKLLSYMGNMPITILYRLSTASSNVKYANKLTTVCTRPSFNYTVCEQVTQLRIWELHQSTTVCTRPSFNYTCIRPSFNYTVCEQVTQLHTWELHHLAM